MFGGKSRELWSVCAVMFSKTCYSSRAKPELLSSCGGATHTIQRVTHVCALRCLRCCCDCPSQAQLPVRVVIWQCFRLSHSHTLNMSLL